MSHFEVAVGHVVVADEASTVGSHHHRRWRTYVIGCSIKVSEGRGGAGPVGTVSYLEISVGDVVVANEGQAVCPDGHRTVLADIAYFVHGGAGGRSTGLVGAMGNLEVAVSHVVVADEGQAAGADGDGGELTDVILTVDCGAGSRSTGRIGAVRNFEIAIGGIVVADEG